MIRWSEDRIEMGLAGITASLVAVLLYSLALVAAMRAEERAACYVCPPGCAVEVQGP